uniref:Uncharacterized protein n=1 Tax=Aliivibrio wodanis TaxID=80852 RepID=A0A5Q4ZSW5_9GAMM|nr:hypothetical protein AW0309160_01863 [Aliivibrio wodanis]
MCNMIKKWWNDHHDKSHNFFAGIHYLVLAIAILVGGGWTIYTFDVFNKAETAQIQFDELERRIKNTESSTIDISSEIIDYSGSKGLIVEITIKNNGKEKLIYNLGGAPLRLYQVRSQGIKLAAKNIIEPKLYTSMSQSKKDGNNKYLECVTLLSSSTKVLSYFIPIEEKGLYYVTFISKPVVANVIDKDGKETKEISCSDVIKNTSDNLEITPSDSGKDDVRWFASKYININ